MRHYAKLLVPAALACAFAGFIDAVYLTALHYLGDLPPCLFGSGCDVVLSSAYAHVGTTPLALFGAGYYLSVLLLLIAYLDRNDVRILRCAGFITAGGVVASLVLVYIQLFVLAAYCMYCLVSAASSLFTAGLICAVLLRLREYQKHPRKRAQV